MTFSIVARCASSGLIGVAVSSSSPAVAARCAHARAGVGAVSSQNVTDPRLGRRALDLMTLGASAAEAVAVLARTGGPMAYRQVLAVDAAGGTAIHSARRRWAPGPRRRPRPWPAAATCWRIPGCPRRWWTPSSAPPAISRPADRRHAAALAAGGEAGPVHSAGLLLVREVEWPVADLRVDWTEPAPSRRSPTSGPSTLRSSTPMSPAPSTPPPRRATACRATSDPGWDTAQDDHPFDRSLRGPDAVHPPSARILHRRRRDR